MNSRTDKYYENNHGTLSRTERNSELYKEINKTELDSFEVRSNATVIGNNKDNIDVEKIKKILDTHYNDAPKRKSIQIEDLPKKEEVKPFFETKEYDINVILDKAKEEKDDDYNEDRAKKLRNTQFDILSSLNLDPNDYIEDYDGDSEKTDDDPKEKTTAKELEELINTISLNEKESKEIKEGKIEKDNTATLKANSDAEDPLDMFADLKGSENTTILEGLQEQTQKILDNDQTQTTALDKSFFTKSNSFKKSDFEDFQDFQDLEEKGMRPIFKILIFILIAAFVAGIVILVKSLIQ